MGRTHSAGRPAPPGPGGRAQHHAQHQTRHLARHRTGRSTGAGFTLVEVLVALAIVAIALAAGARAAGTLSDNAARLQQVSAAQWCADNQLVNLRLARVLPGVGDADFRCEQPGFSGAGTLRTRPTPNPNMRRVEALVRDEAGHTLVTLTTVMSRY